MHNAFHVTPVKGLPKPISGGKWEIVNEFKGRSHRDGGIDIEVSGGQVRHIYAPNEKPDVIAKNGRIWRDIGAGAYGVGEGLLDTLTLGATDQLTDLGYQGLQKLGGSTEDEIREQNSIRGYGTAAGAIAGGFLSGGAATGTAIQQGAKGVGAGVSQGSPNSQFAQAVGTYLPLAGNIAGMAVGNAGFAKGSGLGDFAAKAGKLSKFNPLFQAGMSAMGSTGPQQPINLGPTQEAIRGLTPYTTPGMIQSYKELGREMKGAGGPSNQTSYTNLDGATPAFGGGAGPVQFQQQPVYAENAHNYLSRYGINV
jgi:hypothetical protein